MNRVQSIRTRMLFWTVGVSGLILAALIAWSYVNVRSRLEREMIDRTSYQAELSANRIDRILSSLQGIVQGLTLALEAEALDISFESVRIMQNSALRDNPEFYGIAVAILPSMKPGRWPDPAPYAYRDKGSLVYRSLAEGGKSYTGEDWFTLPQYLNKAQWSEPYLDPPDVKMVTYSVPIHIQGPEGSRFAGVVTCDIDLGWLDRTIANISLGKDGYGFLMSRNGTYISHPLKQIVFNESVFSIAEERRDPELRRIGQGMISGVPGLIDFVSFARDEESWLAWQPLKTADWIMGTIKSKGELRLSLLELARNEAIVGLSGLTLLVIAVWLVAQSITGPVRELGKASKTLASGDLDAVLPSPRGRDEVAQLTKAFSAMRDSLKRYIVDLAETTAAREKMNGELKIAHDIQMDLVPKTFPAFPDRDDMDLFAILDPAREVGGDFYDFFMLDPDRIVLAIGDVSGKGVPAALFMAVTRSFLRSEFHVEPDPGRTLSRVNDELSEGNDSCMFVTLFCAVVRLSDGLVRYANGGHNPPVRLCDDGSLRWISSPHGPASGALPGVEYVTGTFHMNPGESILLYTDGVTEAMNPEKVLYGEDRLASCLLGMHSPQCRSALDTLMDDIHAHVAGAEQSDDITMLMFNWKASTQKGGVGT